MENNTGMRKNNFQSTPCHEVDFDRNLFYVIFQILIHGDWATKLSFLIMGISNIVRGQLIKGIIFLSIQCSFIYFFVLNGIQNFRNLYTLGTLAETTEPGGFGRTKINDDSRKFLLYGVLTIVVIFVFLVIWYESIRSAYEVQYNVSKGIKPNSFYRDILVYFDKKLYKTLLFLPLLGILLFTIAPILFMIAIGFTNYNADNNGTKKLFDWVGLQNFKELFGIGTGDDRLSNTFWGILSWTIVWAILSTFLCYFLGMILAMIINRKGLKLKKLWRTLFIMSVAVPQFVSLLIMQTFLEQTGIINKILMTVGILNEPISWFSVGNHFWARFWVVTVNLWVGIPYTILIVTGILMNIPAELYEAAKVDGANTTTMFFKITLPYMIFVTSPYLITQFIGNINNFSVIYLLSGGGPNDPSYYAGAGKTDLLVTWLYKLTIDEQEYAVCSVIGLCIFVITATLSILTYRQTGSYKNEEEFQ